MILVLMVFRVPSSDDDIQTETLFRMHLDDFVHDGLPDAVPGPYSDMIAGREPVMGPMVGPPHVLPFRMGRVPGLDGCRRT